MANVKLVEVTKRFGDVVAVERISFEVNDGEFFALLGPSGCGKTTTLRIIAGLETPDEGEVYIDGVLVNDIHSKDRNVAMVFQNYALYPHMTVYENIAFPLLVRKRELKLSKDEITKRVKDVAKLLQIEELLDRYPRQLSGGQQQRVALARALVRKPKVWLLDEPLSNLDAKLRHTMRAELRKLQKDLGITAIYVTHDQIEALSMADRVAVLNKGRILQIGTPSELYSKPKDVFVATFIGSPAMNLIPCEFREENGVIRGPNFSKKLDKELSEMLSENLTSNECILGIRPEHAKVSKARVSDESIPAKVLISETLGSEQVVLLSIDGTEMQLKAPAEVKFDLGEPVYISIDWSKAVIFDAKTKKAVY